MMNPKQMGLSLAILIAATTIAIAGCRTEVTANPAQASPIVAQASSNRPIAGTFVAAEKPTKGIARIVDADSTL